ncbi:hypothetical protein [Dickeya zeae]|uniref:TonB C-terminal domain-containing protein n=1 Tax=Dickeya zeae TaxID=204042 RepID=A0ABX8VY79_9GAMM|nr:hypothetical protein [Dickeya zeae]QYM91373.1 hypothetical protein FGI21_05495 [Dickeya zeae]
MKRIAALSLGVILAVPVLAIDMPPPVPIKSIDWLPDSTVRIGQGINAAYRVITQTDQSHEVWLHTDCHSRKKTLLFMNIQPDKGPRVYSLDSIGRYTPGTPFEPDADSLLMTKSELDLCNQNIPESVWRGVSSWEQPGEKLFVDVNNSLRKGDMLKARLATDYDVIRHDEKYGAPYSVKIQDVMLNCEKAESMVLITFSLDNQGIVSDSVVAKDATFTALSPNMIRVAKELCAIKDFTRYTGNGTLMWRKKEVSDDKPAQPDLEHNTSAVLQRFTFPTEVASIIDKALSDSQQRPAFRSLRYTQSGPQSDGVGLMARIDAQPDGTTLTIVKMAIANIAFYSQYQRLFNLVDVKKWETMTDAPWVSKNLDNTIALPLRPGDAYTSHSQIASVDKSGKDKLLSRSCVAGREWRNAAALNPKFPGRYLELICKEDLGDGREASSDYAYLEALKIFVRIGFQDQDKTKRFTFTDVEVTY